MSTSKIIYKGNLRTEAVHLKSNAIIITDAPTDNKGKGEAFSPTDMVATALGSCMLTIIGIKSEEHNIDIENIKMNITKVMSAAPRKISEIIVEFDFLGKSYTNKEKIIIEKSAKSCPVALSLDPELKQTVLFNFKD
ncbi:MAG: osmotically inducible protein OsmC [Flavobacteriales bacterium]|nr:MAG: osmotically inducible protein OsmC [Flavobacteriales bacterium]